MRKLKTIIFTSICSLLLTQLNAQEEIKLETSESEYARANSEFLLIEAEKFFLLEDYSKAIAHLEQAIKTDEKNHAAYFKLAETYFVQEKYKEARENIDQAIALIQNNKYYYVLGAEIQKAQSNPQEAAKYYDLLVNLSEDYYAYLLEIAQIYDQVNRTKDALALIDQKANESGLSENEFIAKARLELSSGESREGRLTLKRAMQKYPRSAIFVVRYLELLEKERDENSLIDYLSNADLFSDELWIAAYQALSILEDKKEKSTILQSAITNPELKALTKTQLIGLWVLENQDSTSLSQATQWQSALEEEFPEDALINENGALLYTTLSQKTRDLSLQKVYKDKAIAYYQQIIDQRPSDLNAWLKVLEFHRKEQSFDLLITDAERALDIFPNQISLYIYYAQGFSGIKDFEEAKSVLNQSLRMAFSNPLLQSQIHANIGEVCLKEGNTDLAIQSFESAIQLSQIHPDAIVIYAEYLSIEEPQRAIEFIEPYVARFTNNLNLIRIKAKALFSLANYSNAEDLLFNGMENNPRQLDGNTLELFGDILEKLGKSTEALTYWKKAKLFGAASENIDRKIANLTN